MLVSVGLAVTLPRPLVQTDVPLWERKEKIAVATSSIAILTIILSVLILRNGATSSDLIAAIVGLAIYVITIIPLLRTEDGVWVLSGR